jgi:hypothetical protein
MNNDIERLRFWKNETPKAKLKPTKKTQTKKTTNKPTKK